MRERSSDHASLLSFPHVGMIVRLSDSERIKNCRMQPPQFGCQKDVPTDGRPVNLQQSNKRFISSILNMPIRQRYPDLTSDAVQRPSP